MEALLRQPLLQEVSHVTLAKCKLHLQAPVRVANAKKSSILNRVKLADFQSSTKIEALREELALMLARDPAAKALVFSQFTSMLDLIYYRLQQVRLFFCQG